MYNTKPQIQTAAQYLELLSKQSELQPSHSDYMGWIVIDPQNATLIGTNYSSLALQIAMNPDIFETIANSYGLTIDSAWESELVLSKIQESEPSTNLF